ncbi:hypothetical protein MRX96_009655 [Rhipicephalus microplus]
MAAVPDSAAGHCALARAKGEARAPSPEPRYVSDWRAQLSPFRPPAMGFRSSRGPCPAGQGRCVAPLSRSGAEPGTTSTRRCG